MVENNHDNDLNDKKFMNLVSVAVNRNLDSDNELSIKMFFDDELDKITILRFNQTLENYLKVSVGNDTYNLTKYDKNQFTDTTIFKKPNSGGYLLQQWNTKCIDKKNSGKIQDFVRSATTKSPTGDSRLTSLPPLVDNFLYKETSPFNHGEDVDCSFERTYIIQISNTAFYYNSFSILTRDSQKAKGRFRIHLLLENNTWSTHYNTPKNIRYSDSSNDWTLLSLDFTVENYGINLIFDRIDTPHADTCFSNITMTYSVY